jgi:hypothetical protein
VALGRLPTACGVFALAVGVSSVIGWLLVGSSPGPLVFALTTMKLNTAIALALAGASLLVQAHARPPGLALALARAAALVVLALAAITLVEYAARQHWIDNLVVDDAREVLSAPGRMSPLTAIALACLGVGLLSLDAPERSWMRSVVLAIAASLGVLALVGYVLGAHALYGIGDFTRVTPQTALALFALAAGQLAARPDRGLLAVLATDTFAGVMARRLDRPARHLPAHGAWHKLQV